MVICTYIFLILFVVELALSDYWRWGIIIAGLLVIYF